jgi:membrane protein
MICLATLTLIASIIINVVLTPAAAVATDMMPHIAGAARFGSTAGAFCVMFALFAFSFKYIPNANILWSDVWRGALLTALLFMLGQFLIGLYLSRTSLVSGYGAAGSFAALIIWVYYSAQIFFLGAEFTHVFAHRLGSHKDKRD